MASEVEVWIYDLSKGMARSMSMAFLGKQIDGIWHTSIVVYGKEYFFGGDSIECCTPGGTIIGQPGSKVKLGVTEIPYEIFHEHLRELSITSFRPSDYHILTRNCNNFSSELAQFLTGNDIPSHITSLPEEVLSTPFGQMIRPMLESMTVNPGQGAERVFGESAPSHRVAQNSVHTNTHTASHTTGQPQATHRQASEATKTGTESHAVTLKSDKVMTMADINCGDKLNEEEKTLITELLEYTYTSDNKWSISPTHINALGSLFSGNEDRRTNVWILYQQLLTKPDTVHIVKRAKESSYLDHIDMDIEDCLKSLCNLCSSTEGYTHLLSKSRHLLEQLPGLLNNRKLLEISASIMLNVSIHHKLVDDLDIPYTSALVEYLNSHDKTSPQNLVLMLNTLKNFMSRNQEVRMLAFTIGLQVSKYSTVCAEENVTLRQLCDSVERMRTN